ncbi:hypothetical protein [Pseudoxanthomonas indica]|jgi:hypothetical protein|uniref:Uncharacterized protein n=1 Tax=Pseudoxanthomonas indica TaxID=428993 RepID=A0A1T5IRD8_9GAMM|nr:hypothetical protein [Pseudoxanthomonas indica]GGD53732.1 hypothetical protein GCM10007235_27510 [Pseudoxanthomonas indica]SKC41513.1 hypothetical protein SAMN06296058_0168 [Pseudoxanthomonas indica]
MSAIDQAPEAALASDSTLLEGLFQLTVTGHTQDWEFERLNNAVYERLLSSYAMEEIGSAKISKSMVG